MVPQIFNFDTKPDGDKPVDEHSWEVIDGCDGWGSTRPATGSEPKGYGFAQTSRIMMSTAD